MRNKIYSFLLTFLLLNFCLITYALCTEISGWIKSETCWVVEQPSAKAKIVGIIIKGAAVTGLNVGNGWVKIIFAPVRNLIKGRNGMKEGQLFNCNGCYIRRLDISIHPPGRW